MAVNISMNTPVKHEAQFLGPDAKTALLNSYAAAGRRLILLDYDGTLIPFAEHPSRAKPGDALAILEKVTAIAANDVFIISGRDSATLEKWFGHLPLGLIAEHGAKLRYKDGSWQEHTADTPQDWKLPVKKLMEAYTVQCPETFIEEKEYAIAWHYRKMPATALDGAKELFRKLLDGAGQWPVNVLDGHKVIEVRLKGADKGTAIERLLSRASYDFILSVGDDITDEDMFEKLAGRPEAFTIKIGKAATAARYSLHTPFMVQSLLTELGSQPKQ